MAKDLMITAVYCRIHACVQQRWEVTKYKYFVTLLLIFLVSVLHNFSGNVSFHSWNFEHKYLYFLLLHFNARLDTLILTCIWWLDQYYFLEKGSRQLEEWLMLWMKQRELAMSTWLRRDNADHPWPMAMPGECACVQGSKLAPAKRQWRVDFWTGD